MLIVILSLAKFETKSNEAEDVDTADGQENTLRLPQSQTRFSTRKITPVDKGTAVSAVQQSQKATSSAEKGVTKPKNKKSTKDSHKSATKRASQKSYIPLLPLPVISPVTTAITTPLQKDLGFELSNSSASTFIRSDTDFKLLQIQVDDTHRIVSAINNKLDLHQQSKQPVSSEAHLLNAEVLKQEKLATALVEERLRTKEIYNDQLENALNLQQYNDQRDRVQHELKIKQQMAEVDAEAYRISKMITARATDPLLAEKEAHKRKLEEMQAVAQCQIELMRATSGCNVTASIMNNCVNNTDQSVYDEEDVN